MRRAAPVLLALPLLAGCPRPDGRSLPPGTAPPLPGRSCREADLPPAPSQDRYADYAERRRGCHKKWTILIYMQADNDLQPWASFNLAELEAGAPSGPPTASGPEVDVVVQLDAQDAGLRRLHVFPQGRALPGEREQEFDAFRPSSPVVETLPEPPEPEVGQPEADLGAFVAWGMKRYPAQHYLVAVWGHGRGWGLPQRERPPPAPPGTDPFLGSRFAGGIGFDWTQRTYLGIPTLRDALRRSEQEALGGQPVDVYLSDACLMQSVEVAAELSGTARYLVGSTQIEDFAGTPYADLVAMIHEGRPAPGPCQGRPDQEACAVAHALPELFERSFQGGARARLRQGAREHLTLSAVRAGELSGSLLPALSRLGAELSRYIAADPLLNGGDVQCVLAELDRCRIDGTSFLGNSRDLGTFLQALDRARQDTPAGAELHRAIVAVEEALGRTVIAHRAGTSYPREKFRALSLWVPLSRQDYRAHRDRFAPSLFFQHGKAQGASQSPWQEWLDRVWR